MKPLDVKRAKRAARGGAFAAVVLAVATGLFGFLVPVPSPQANITRLFAAWAPADILLYAEILLYAAIAIGLYKMSRAAAVAGLILYTAERVFVWADYGRVAPIMLIFLLAFAIAVRGTFAYHRLVRGEAAGKATPSGAV